MKRRSFIQSLAAGITALFIPKLSKASRPAASSDAHKLERQIVTFKTTTVHVPVSDAAYPIGTQILIKPQGNPIVCLGAVPTKFKDSNHSEICTLRKVDLGKWKIEDNANLFTSS